MASDLLHEVIVLGGEAIVLGVGVAARSLQSA